MLNIGGWYYMRMISMLTHLTPCRKNMSYETYMMEIHHQVGWWIEFVFRSCLRYQTQMTHVYSYVWIAFKPP